MNLLKNFMALEAADFYHHHRFAKGKKLIPDLKLASIKMEDIKKRSPKRIAFLEYRDYDIHKLRSYFTLIRKVRAPQLPIMG